MNSKDYRSDFLFSNPNFWVGMGSVLNVAGDYFAYNSSKSGLTADFRAIEADWGVVGKDLRESAVKIAKECNLPASK